MESSLKIEKKYVRVVEIFGKDKKEENNTNINIGLNEISSGVYRRCLQCDVLKKKVNEIKEKTKEGWLKVLRWVQWREGKNKSMEMYYKRRLQEFREEKEEFEKEKQNFVKEKQKFREETQEEKIEQIKQLTKEKKELRENVSQITKDDEKTTYREKKNKLVIIFLIIGLVICLVFIFLNVLLKKKEEFLLENNRRDVWNYVYCFLFKR